MLSTYRRTHRKRIFSRARSRTRKHLSAITPDGRSRRPRMLSRLALGCPWLQAKSRCARVTRCCSMVAAKVLLQVGGCKLNGPPVTCGASERLTLERGANAPPGPGWESSLGRWRHSGGSNGDAARGALAAAAPPRGGHSLTYLLCVFQAFVRSINRPTFLPCLSTLSVYKNAAIPARLVHQHTAAAPVAWIPWR